MAYSMYDIMATKEMAMGELAEFGRKNKQLTTGQAEVLCNLATAAEKMCKIIQMEGEDCYSEGAGDWAARGRYSSGRDYRMMDRSAAGNMGGMGGSSYAGRHWVRGHYSRDGARDAMIAKMEEEMRNASTQEERERYRMAIDQLRD